MYRYVPFDEIEQNKWNGTVYYSPNGTAYGYYWYLKALWREWDAIVEDDYESVMPILPRRMSRGEDLLVPELGPYSVNALTPARVGEMLDLARQYSQDRLHPLSSRVKKLPDNYPSKGVSTAWRLDTIDDIDVIRSSYDASVTDRLAQSNSYKIDSGIKPEKIVKVGKLSSVLQNTLLRITYNAMHRGIGWSSGMLDQSTGEYQALSFFVSTNNKIFEIYAAELYNSPARQRMLDLLIYNSAGKPNQIISAYQSDSLKEMGFAPVERHKVQVSDSLSDKISKWLGR
jgi:hypothetical protein